MRCRPQRRVDTIGIRGIVGHAISEDVKAFYMTFGLDPSRDDPMTLMVTLDNIRKVLE